MYRCPGANIAALEVLFDSLQAKPKDFPHVVLAGHFNLPDINCDSVIPIGRCEHAKFSADAAFSNNLAQLVPTAVTTDCEL